jgi:hypothetical protein
VGSARFFSDDGMDFATRCVLSGVRHGMAEVGEVLVACEQIVDGDASSWLEVYLGLGRRLHDQARAAAADGHTHSAWNAALRATNYLFAALWWAPATPSAGSERAYWDEHRSAWELAVDHWPTPVDAVQVPSGGTTLPGYWFRPVRSLDPRRSEPDAAVPPVLDAELDGVTIVLLQGLHTPISDACMTGLDGAIARGAHVLLIEGPGQGAALVRQGLTLEDDGRRVVDAAFEWLRSRTEVDPARIVLYGINHGAYLALSGLARCTAAVDTAALVLDPGATDLGSDARAAAQSAEGDASQLALLAGTTTVPTGTRQLDDALAALDRCCVGAEDLARVRCPVLVVEAEDATSFATQGATLVDALGAQADVVRLTHAEGAGADCGLDASQIHDAATFDLLADLLAASDPVPTPGAPR